MNAEALKQLVRHAASSSCVCGSWEVLTYVKVVLALCASCTDTTGLCIFLEHSQHHTQHACDLAWDAMSNKPAPCGRNLQGLLVQYVPQVVGANVAW